MSMKATYEVNGVPLDDPQGRWFLLDKSGTPGTSSVVASLVESPNIHGKAAVGSVRRSVGRLVLTLLVDGRGSHEVLRENWALLLNAFSSWRDNGSVVLTYFDGAVRMSARVIVTGVTQPQLLDDGSVYEVSLTLTLPDPFWVEDVEYKLFVRPGVERLWANLGGGSAPVQPRVVLQGGGITQVSVTCGNTGYAAVWRGAGVSSLEWDGWTAGPGETVKHGVEDVPILYPDSNGDYRVTVDVVGQCNSAALVASRRFQ